MRRDHWPEVKLGDHVDLLSGFAFKSKDFTNNPDDIPLVKGANVHQGYIDWDGAVRWPKDDFETLEKFQLKENDVVLAMDRPWIGAGLKYSWIKKRDPKSLLVQRVSRLRGVNGLSTRYLRYVIGSPQFTGYIKPIVTGVNIPHISGGQIKDYRFLLPPEEYQDSVADILEGYDNLIENNNRRIAILEEMAQSLYREWFVKFRFPGHENAKLIDSPLGKIPEGWEVKKLGEVALINPESITKKNAPDNIKYIDIKSVGIGTIDEIKSMPFSEAPSRARQIVRDGDIIWATVRPNRKQYSYIARPEENTVVSTGFAVIRAEKVPKSYLMQVVSTDAFVSYLVNHATGAAYPAVNSKDFESADILVPDGEVLEMFDDVASVAVSQCETLKRTNRNLITQREQVLPKLISGDIVVSGKERE